MDNAMVADLQEFADRKAFVTFFVPGVPTTAGSKRAFPIYRGKKGQRVFTGRVTVSDDTGQRGKNWRAVVQHAMAAVAPRVLFAGPLVLRCTFSLPRPKADFRADGSLKITAPAWPAKKPDLTKLLRAIEDAAKQVLWADDAQVVQQATVKVYATPVTPVGVTIWVGSPAADVAFQGAPFDYPIAREQEAVDG